MQHSRPARSPAKKRNQFQRVPRTSTALNLHNVPRAKLQRRNDYFVSPQFLTSPKGLAATINDLT
jgi:hypothetical protein